MSISYAMEVADSWLLGYRPELRYAAIVEATTGYVVLHRQFFMLRHVDVWAPLYRTNMRYWRTRGAA